MRILILAAFLTTVALSPAAFAHHPAADIVDEEIYAMIDAMVADTPHADLVFDDMGGTTTIEITGRITDLQQMIDADLLSYLALLDGDVTVSLTFSGPRALVLVIEQVEDASAADKAAPLEDRVDFGELKLLFR